MRLTFLPAPDLHPNTVSVATGNVLTIDGVDYDLSAVPEGGAGIPQGEHPFVGTITRRDSVISTTVKIRVDAAYERAVLDDAPRWTIEAADGPVELPAPEAAP